MHGATIKVTQKSVYITKERKNSLEWKYHQKNLRQWNFFKDKILYDIMSSLWITNV